MWGGDPRTWIALGGPCRGGQASRVAPGGTVGPATVVVELLRGRALGWGGPAVLRGAGGPAWFWPPGKPWLGGPPGKACSGGPYGLCAGGKPPGAP